MFVKHGNQLIFVFNNICQDIIWIQDSSICVFQVMNLHPVSRILLPGLQVPLQRLLGELADAQLALLAGHHDARPAEAHGHFHPEQVSLALRAQPPTLGGRPEPAGLETRGVSARRPLRAEGSRQRPFHARAGGNRGGGGSAKGYLLGGRGPGTRRLRGRLLLLLCRCCSCSGPARAVALRPPK